VQGLGICIASLGPALLELAVQTNSTLTHVGYVFGIRSIGYLVGSFGGPLYVRTAVRRRAMRSRCQR